MTNKSGASKGKRPFPNEVRTLIVRKVAHLRREHEAKLMDSRSAIEAAMMKEARPKVSNKGATAFAGPAETAYKEIVRTVRTATKEWPGIVWGAIKPILDGVQVSQYDAEDLNSLVDELAWVIGQDPFTLGYVDQKRFKEMVYRETARYGGFQESAMTGFNRALELSGSGAKAGVGYSANQGREGVGIAIAEYVIGRGHNKPQQHDVNLMSMPAPLTIVVPRAATDNNITCLPNPPKKVNNWFLAIRDMALAFQTRHGRCPNEAEAWGELRNNPPQTYGITSGKHRGEQAVLMDEGALGKRSFNGRWERYTTIK